MTECVHLLRPDLLLIHGAALSVAERSVAASVESGSGISPLACFMGAMDLTSLAMN